MKRNRQTIDEILGKLSIVESDWRDDHAEAVIALLKRLPERERYTRADLIKLFDHERSCVSATAKTQFEASLTVVRLFLDLSRDELTAALKQQVGPGIGVKRLQREPDRFYSALEALGVSRACAKS